MLVTALILIEKGIAVILIALVGIRHSRHRVNTLSKRAYNRYIKYSSVDTVRGAFKKYAEFFNFLLISIYNEFIFQDNFHHGRCTSPGDVSIHLYHF